MRAQIQPLRAYNPNLHAQEGLFTVIDDPDQQRDATPNSLSLDQLVVERLRERENDGISYNTVMYRLELPVSEAGKLLRLLGDEWVTATHLYPGFDGVAKGLREKVFWD